MFRSVLRCVPSHVEVDVLNRVLPHVDDDVYIGSVPAPGGFDWKAEHALKRHNKTAVVFGMGAIPWMCKVAEYGRVVIGLWCVCLVDYCGEFSRWFCGGFWG